MNRVQELIDENMDKIPVALAKTLLDACKEEADNTKKLYKLTWTVVNSYAYVVEVDDEPDFAQVKQSHKTQTLIVRAIDDLFYHPNGFGRKVCSIELPDQGMVLQSWVEHFAKQPLTPLVIVPCHNGA